MSGLILPRTRAHVLVKIASVRGHTFEQDLEEALAWTEKITMAHDRAPALAALIPMLEGKAREKALKQAMEATQKIEYGWLRAKAIKSLAPCLTGNLFVEAWKKAQAIEDEWWRVEAFVALIPHLPERRNKTST
jgi:hypothetical protein